MLNDEKKYIKDCKHVFPFYGKKEKTFLQHLNEGVVTYCDSQSNIDYSDITKEFGTPKSVMESYINSCDNEYILKRMKILSLLKKFVIVIIGFLLVITLLELYTINQMKTEKILKEDETIEIYE